MIIIAFSSKTSKVLPRIICDKFVHCAPIAIKSNGDMLMYQFVRAGHVEKIKLNMRDIGVLRAHGWRFVFLGGDIRCAAHNRFVTCVSMTKYMVGYKSWRVQTPDALYRKIVLHNMRLYDTKKQAINVACFLLLFLIHLPFDYVHLGNAKYV